MSNNEDSFSGLKPPKNLQINNEMDMSNVWKNWLQQYHWYEVATNIKKKEAAVQVATFMTIIGPEAVAIYNTFNLKEAEQNQVELIKKKFEEYFVPKINITYERYVFNKIEQKCDENFDVFLTRLKSKCKNCAFGKLETSLICDRIVVGIKSDTVRERLLAEDKLTLETAINICRANEQAKRQLQNMKEGQEMQQVNVIKTKKETKKVQNKEDTFNCKRCGKTHGKKSCPAYGKKCKKCQKVGHFAKQCKTKEVATISEESEDNDILLIQTINTEKSSMESWYETLKLPKDIKVNFKLDSGAQCNVITEKIARLANLKVNKSKTKNLVSFSNHHIEVKGECVTEIQFKEKKEEIKFLIVQENVQAVLGKETCVQLGLIKRVDTLTKELCEGLGCFKGFVYDIELVENPKLVIHPPRRIPYAIRDEVKKELDNMTRLGIIEPINEPTPAASPLVVVKQKDKLRLCIDPSDINKNLKRRHYPLNTLEEVAAKINGSKWFTLLDCKKGFWQIPVTERTSRYLTCATPWGRYKCKRLPFGLASAPEIFQQIMCSILKDIKNVECSMDDILVHATSLNELREKTNVVLKRLQKAGLKLNADKCKLEKNQIKFLGHLLTGEGLLPDPEKVNAISRIKTPTNITELQRFLGMVTYLAKFIPNLSDLTAPLRELLKKEIEWVWDHPQKTAFNDLKEKLKNLSLLAYYDPKEEVTLSVDASSKAVGAVMLQQGRPIAYCAKSLTETQKKYSQLEKEMLAITTACKKFHVYIWGNQKVEIETDHKPLETILKRNLHEAPARLQRMIIEVLPYNLIVKYKKGTELYIADTLSRDCQTDTEIEDNQNQLSIHVIIPMSSKKLKHVKKLTEKDAELNALEKQILQGWPEDKSELPDDLIKYWTYKEQMSCHENLIFKNNRILIPSEMRGSVMKACHLSHKGIEGSLRLARDNVFWPNMTTDITNYVKSCKTCNKLQRNKQMEPILKQEIPSRPWSIVGSDLFELNGNHYIVISDSYSGYFEFEKLNTLTSKEIISSLKKCFAVHGIPDIVMTDNGKQYASEEFKLFTDKWQFIHRYSSPKFPRSNGLAERYVQEAKNLIKKCKDDDSDLQLALLHHRNTPRDNLGSPVQRLMGRRTKTLLPTPNKLLLPKIIPNIENKLNEKRDKEKFYADRGKKEEREFNSNEEVLFKNGNEWLPAKIIQKLPEPRSYVIQPESGRTLRRNSWYLRKTKVDPIPTTVTKDIQRRNAEIDMQPEPETEEVPNTNETNKDTAIRTRYGREITKPKKLDL